MDKWTLPQTTDWMKSQMAHDPSRAYAQELFDLIALHPYDRMLEIGAAWGLSTLAILLAQDKGMLTSVDKDPTIKATEEVKVNNLAHRWKLYLMPSAQFWTENQGLKGTYDIIYVDGSHLYEDVFNDLFHAWDYLKPGGLLVLDDVTHKANHEPDPATGKAIYGVSLALWQLMFAKNIKTIDFGPRLAWMYKP